MGCIICVNQEQSNGLVQNHYNSDKLDYYAQRLGMLNLKLDMLNLTHTMINFRYNRYTNNQCRQCGTQQMNGVLGYNCERIKLLVKISLEKYKIDKIFIESYFNNKSSNLLKYLSTILTRAEPNFWIPNEIINIICEYIIDNYRICIKYIKGFRVFIYDETFNVWYGLYKSCIDPIIYQESESFRLRNSIICSDILDSYLLYCNNPLADKKPVWFLSL